ncbi:MAG TPA: ATP-binding protein [Ferruginibacter sp.]|nr:ATP-binding protein [Ferruginibacter sp.]HMP20171.1 ATP-binding protein [Ferruginibacter sp.]
MKTQSKTTILLLSAFFAIILIFSVFIYLSVSNYSYEDFYKLLEIRAITTAKTELEENVSPDARDLRDEFFEKLPHEKDYIFKLEPGENFYKVSAKMNIPVDFFKTIIDEGKAEYHYRSLFYKGIKYSSSKGNFIVITSAENYYEVHHAVYLKRTLVLAIAAAFILSLGIAIYFSKYVFKPITKITERVKQISSENLHLRLPVTNKNDELNELSVTFNDMLNRIETSFETQNNFVSNASHELRTPLTAIIGEADVALSKIRSTEEYIETIKIVLDEAEKLDKKTKALLFLAQTGFNGKIQKFDKVRIDQLLWDVKETIEKINPDSKIFIDTSLLPENPVKLKVKGNEQLLHLALTNIISNACKYSNYKTVYVSIGASDNKVIVIVKDSGIGIPESELKYIYDPFFRASNTKNYEGYGIGLPLTNNIIKMHNGEIIVSSLLDSGTTVQINLPIGNYEI